MRNTIVGVAGLILGSLAMSSSIADDQPKEKRGPLSPEKAMAEYRVAKGLKLELVAAEPQIESPVAMAFDEDGKLWVVEMRDYPNGPGKDRAPEGRIKVLEDKDGDGRYEAATIFADELLFANGLMPWKGGVVVTAAPAIWYMKDTDGDGKADVKEKLYEGFAAENPQLHVSHPVLGLDNWIYVVNGLRGGTVKRSGKDDKPLNLSGMDFRFDLVRDRHEAVSGMGQYGNTFDDWGHRFVCTNRNHCVPIVIDQRYLHRNPFMAPPEPARDNQNAGGAAKIYPLSKNFTTSTLHAGTFTASCGVTIYRGSLLAEYRDRTTAFTCDPTGNLVHVEPLRDDRLGFPFADRPADAPKVEFLASPDDWSRPVNLAHGPDGSLYVVDMYRAVIEHPDFMPPELKKRPDLLLGKDKGRINRIVPEKHETKAIRPNLGKATTADLVALLDHENGWQRDTARRLLLERQDQAAFEPLAALMKSTKNARTRSLAAWTIEGLGKWNEELAVQLLKDAIDDRVLEQALILCEPWLAKSDAVQRLVEDVPNRTKHPRVLFQLALTTGGWNDKLALVILERIATAEYDPTLDAPWLHRAILTAIPERSGELVALLLRKDKNPRPLGVPVVGKPTLFTDKASPERLALLHEVASVAGARQNRDEVARTLSSAIAVDRKDALRWQTAVLNGLADGMTRRGRQLGKFLATFADAKPDLVAGADKMFAASAELALDAQKPTTERLDAIRLLAHASWKVAQKPLVDLLAEDKPQEMRLAAVRSMSAHQEKEVGDLLTTNWNGHTPAMRREIVEAMLAQPGRIRQFLALIETGKVRPGEIDAVRTRQLLTHREADIKEKAGKLLKDNVPANRKEVLDKYREALKMKADPKRGFEVFKKNCITCHRIMGQGVDVAPDISDTRTKTPEMLLTDILSPNAAIDNNYINYSVTTKAGKVLTGYIAAETPASITLKRAENQVDVVLRQDIEELVSTGVSLMPDGLEKQITVAEMADLISFIKNWRYLDGSVPVGQK